SLEHQLSFSNQLIFDELEHFLIGGTVLPHLVLVLVQEGSNFFIDTVFQSNLCIHCLKQRFCEIETFRNLNHFLLSELFNELYREQPYIFSSQRHLLLAAPYHLRFRAIARTLRAGFHSLAHATSYRTK